MNPTVLNSTDAKYPARLHERLGEHTPRTLTALGDFALLSQTKTGLFCSVRCPGDKILAAYDTARKLRDGGVAVISGFHSPVEGMFADTIARETTDHYLLGARLGEDSAAG